jgi:hypothetical protein
MSEPTTTTGKELFRWITDGVVTTRRAERQQQVIAIEAEASQQERERLSKEVECILNMRRFEDGFADMMEELRGLFGISDD